MLPFVVQYGVAGVYLLIINKIYQKIEHLVLVRSLFSLFLLQSVCKYTAVHFVMIGLLQNHPIQTHCLECRCIGVDNIPHFPRYTLNCKSIVSLLPLSSLCIFIQDQHCLFPRNSYYFCKLSMYLCFMEMACILLEFKHSKFIITLLT